MQLVFQRTAGGTEAGLTGSHPLVSVLPVANDALVRSLRPSPAALLLLLPPHIANRPRVDNLS